ncbi:CYFA0S12e03334g1_1 [Cyberlindnera fabianii]|uniref:CYFA0S12e03334g1_1 n=1 Tax=Cyberlindnera fabianii TaxID=36022 RepID=A0A061B1A4_CYBFA|nr:CYFA0S12e03334g1_1 [Cyberlindnera fabianii]
MPSFKDLPNEILVNVLSCVTPDDINNIMLIPPFGHRLQEIISVVLIDSDLSKTPNETGYSSIANHFKVSTTDDINKIVKSSLLAIIILEIDHLSASMAQLIKQLSNIVVSHVVIRGDTKYCNQLMGLTANLGSKTASMTMPETRRIKIKIPDYDDQTYPTRLNVPQGATLSFPKMKAISITCILQEVNDGIGFFGETLDLNSWFNTFQAPHLEVFEYNEVHDDDGDDDDGRDINSQMVSLRQLVNGSTMANLESLRLHSAALDLVSNLDLPQLTNMMITSISSLSLINIKAPRLERLRLDVDSISKLQDCHFPQLRLLSLGDVSSPAPIDEMTFPNMDQVDFNCFNNVRELDILSSNPRVWSRFPLVRLLKICSPPRQYERSDFHSCVLPTLQQLTFSQSNSDLCQCWPFAPNDSLKILTLKDTDCDSSRGYGILLQWYPSLTHFSIYITLSEREVQDIDLSFTNFQGNEHSNLEVLGIRVFKGDLNEIALPRCNLPNLTNLSISCGDEYRTPDSLVTQILGLDTSLYPQLRKLHLKDVFIEEDVDLNFLVNLEAIDLNNVFNIPLIMGEVPHLKSAFIDVTDIEIVKDDHDNVLFPSLECLLLGRSLSTMERQYLINISNANADVIQC